MTTEHSSQGVNIYTTAFKLLTLGFSVIPSGAGPDRKAPAVEWQSRQQKPADANELQDYQDRLNPPLWGIVTGAVSGVIVVDTDDADAGRILEAEGLKPHVLTPRGGGHFYFQHPGYHVKTCAGILPKLDVKGDGGFVNVAGSSKFGKYKILTLPTLDTIYPWDRLPKRILAALNSSKPSTKAQQQGAPIPETKRNATMTSIAGAMRRQGADQAAIEAALLEINARQCAPPLPEREVLAIAGSVARYEPQPETSQRHFNLTDYGNAERLVSLYGDVIRYSPERKSWLIWTGKVWEWDLGGVRIAKLAKMTARNIYREAADEPDDDQRKELIKHARATERQVRLDAMIKSVESEPGIAITVADLDTNYWLLNVNNGTIDLRTGVLKLHDPADLITEILPLDYDPDATNTEWDTFLSRIFSDNTELIAYVQRGMGYSITGDQGEQVFFFCYGSGFNGKSTLLNAVRLVMGNYATQVPPTAFMVDKNKRGGPDEAIASLKNKRLVCSTELEDGQRLSVSLVKRMTGGEPLWCEHKFERGYNFQPTHKLWLSGNHEPVITDTTNSIWYRLKKIPFTFEIPENERKKGYGEYLVREHGSAILTWLVKGCVEWKRTGGLGEPETVTRAVAEYRDQQDILHNFLVERCLFKKSESVDQAELYKTYKAWCEENDTYIISKPNFTNRIQEKGAITGKRGGNKSIWRGIRLLTDDERVIGVTGVIGFPQSFLHEASTGKTLHNIDNSDNPDNPTTPSDDTPDYPHERCPTCGGDDFWQPNDNRWICGRCHPRPQEIDMEV